MGNRLLPALTDRIKMRDNQRDSLRRSEPTLNEDQLSKAIDTIDWEYRQRVYEDVQQILADSGRFSRHRGDVAWDLTAYITRGWEAHDAQRLQGMSAAPASMA